MKTGCSISSIWTCERRAEKGGEGRRRAEKLAEAVRSDARLDEMSAELGGQSRARDADISLDLLAVDRQRISDGVWGGEGLGGEG